MNTCVEVKYSLGVYVLGAIDPADRSQVESHLAGCPACRDELAGLAGLPALLSRVSEAQITQVSGDGRASRPSGDMLEGLLDKAAGERRSRGRGPGGPGRTGRLRVAAGRWAPLAAAAAVLLVVGALFGGLVLSGGEEKPQARPPATSLPTTTTSPTSPTGKPTHEETPKPEVLSAKNPLTRTSAKADLTATEAGTNIVLHLRTKQRGATCRMVAKTRDGRRESLGSWKIAYDYGEFSATTRYRREVLSSIDLITDDGDMLLTIPA